MSKFITHSVITGSFAVETMTGIKILMTLAMIFYAIGIYLGVKQRSLKLPRFVHISFALFGFVLDMWATMLMESLRSESWEVYPPLLASHTVVSLLAILTFLSMFLLGIKKKIKTHRKVVWWAFMPSWLLAYATGMALVV